MTIENMGIENGVMWFKARSGNTEAFGYCDNDGIDTLEERGAKAAKMARRCLEKMLLQDRHDKAKQEVQQILDRLESNNQPPD